MKFAQLCLTLLDPMNCTVHGILQARILEWVPFPFPRIFPTQGSNPGLMAARGWGVVEWGRVWWESLFQTGKKNVSYTVPHQLEQDAAWRNRSVLLKKRRTRERIPRGAPGSEGAGRKELGWEVEELEVMS